MTHWQVEMSSGRHVHWRDLAEALQASTVVNRQELTAAECLAGRRCLPWSNMNRVAGSVAMNGSV
jgi:hypothetical protein